jgi:hypothetical protein
MTEYERKRRGMNQSCPALMLPSWHLSGETGEEIKNLSDDGHFPNKDSNHTPPNTNEKR